MRFAANAEGVVAADIKRIAIKRRIAERFFMKADGFLGDLGKAGAAYPRHRAGKIAVNEFLRQSDRVEDLGAAIGLVGRNAHLRHDFQKTLVDRLDVALARLLPIDLIGEIRRHRGERLEGEVGIDRLRPIAREQREMVDLPRVAGFDDEADRGAKALADQMMMHRRCRTEAPGSESGRGRPGGRTE